jgi:hypothetical protein
MRKHPGRLALRTWALPALLALVAALSILIWRRSQRPHVTTAPFTYNGINGSLRFQALVQGRPCLLEFDTLAMKTVVARSLYERLNKAESGIDTLSPSADFALEGYHAHLFYDEAEESAFPTRVEGMLGIDMFAPSPGFEGRNVRRGARITLDFKAGLARIEDGPSLEPLRLPKGTVQTALLRDSADGPYYVIVPLNGGGSYRFALGVGEPNVILPTGSVRFISHDATHYVDAVGGVPVTLTFSGQDETVQAIALHRPVPSGVLGMSLLANYRVVLDFRNNLLYLEPPDSPSDF